MKKLLFLICVVVCTAETCEDPYLYEGDIAYRGQIAYWSTGSTLYPSIVDEAADTMILLGYRFVRVQYPYQAQITIEPYSGGGTLCDNPDRVARTYSCGRIVVCPWRADEPWKIAHEFGHALGASHIDDPNKIGLMEEDGGPRRWTWYDAEKIEQSGLSSIWECVQ